MRRFTGEIKQDCKIRYNECTNTNVQYVEDPYEADVNNTPGVMIWVCDECLHEIHMDI